MNQQYSVILLGPPGSGKTTLTNRLAARNDKIDVIKTGRLLRAEVDQETTLGQRLKPFLEEGDLAPIELVSEALEKAVRGSEQTVLLFDGFPRNEAQIEPFFELNQAAGRTLTAVFVLELADSVVMKRLTGRRVCPNCGAIYNIHFDPPAQPGVCDRCGAKLEQRADDKPAVVEKRLAAYKEETAPVVTYFNQNYPDLTHTVSAEKAVDQVVGDVFALLRRDLDLDGA